MARIRTIKPTFWLDDKLGAIKREARLLYIGLWNLSDDRGVFEWRPAKIRVQIFPYDTDINNQHIVDWLNLLLSIKNIIKFEENGESYGYIPSFLKHQEIKKPSLWTYTENIPETNSTPPVGEQLPTSNPAVPIGSREWGVGSREKETSSKEEVEKKAAATATATAAFDKNKKAFEVYREELRGRFPDIDFNAELEKFNLYWYGGTKRVKNANLALLNWMTKAREIKGGNNGHSGNSQKPVSSSGYKQPVHDLSTWNNI